MLGLGVSMGSKSFKGSKDIIYTIGVHMQAIQGFESNALWGVHDKQNSGNGKIDSAARQGA